MNQTFTTDLVAVVDDRITTTSLKIAEVFGKRHDNVIQSIESLEVPDSWHILNFQEMYTEVKIGNGATRQSKAYTITRDGFTLLAMGFTGAKAMQFKLAYIEAFNRMEEMIKEASRRNQLSGDVLLATLSTEIERRVKAEAEASSYRENLRRIAASARLSFGELSEATGLPKDIVVASHCKSSRRPHRIHSERFVQLVLPLQQIVDEARRQLGALV